MRPIKIGDWVTVRHPADDFARGDWGTVIATERGPGSWQVLYVIRYEKDGQARECRSRRDNLLLRIK